MNNLQISLKERLELLEKAIKKAEREPNAFTEGRLRISKSPTQTRYYKMTRKMDTKGEYIPADKMDTVRRLAQGDYNKKFLKHACEELELLKKFKTKYTEKTAEYTYEHLSQERKKLVTPYILSDELFAKEWQAKTYKPNPYMSENRIYDTRNGERVRSKSEAILADMFYELGIPYRYECPLRLKNGVIKYPDFTLLKVDTKEEFYLEHFGMLDNELYRRDNMRKLDEYRDGGIYLGKNLLITYETEDNPLDIKGIRRMFKEMF